MLVVVGVVLVLGLVSCVLRGSVFVRHPCVWGVCVVKVSGVGIVKIVGWLCCC